MLHFLRIFLHFDYSNPLIFQMCFMKRTMAYLCPKMINFNAVDYDITMTYRFIYNSLFPSDHFSLNDTEFVPLSADNIFATAVDSENCFSTHHWTFTTNSQLRIQITFQEFNFKENEYLEIGDGLDISDETRLAHFIGDAAPSNVTSVSNSAWINIVGRHGSISSRANMIIRAITITGTCSC